MKTRLTLGSLVLAALVALPMSASAQHPPATDAAAQQAKAAKVPKATGPEARTVAEVFKGKAALKDKTVQVRGRVVKINSGIKGKNWLHLQDGSGTAADGNHDLIVTTVDTLAVGDIVNARGTVRTDVVVGPGYAYDVLVEATAVKK